MAGHGGVADREDALAEPMQASGVDPPGDRASGIPEPQQLPMRDDPVLQRRQPRQRPVMSRFFPHAGNKCDIGGGSPPGEHLFACVESGSSACL